LPHFINKEYQNKYLNAHQKYIECRLNKFQDLNEDNIFWLAVVGYHYRDLEPLKTLDFYLNELTDKNFFLYLSNDETLFYSCMELEMYRRRITNKLELISIPSQIKYQYPKQYNILSVDRNLSEKILSEHERHHILNKSYVPQYIFDLGNNFLYNTSLNDWKETINNYGSKVINLCDQILKAGGIIAGGFVNSIINPTYFLYKLTVPSSRYNSNCDYICNELRHIGLYRRIFDVQHFINDDFCNCVRAWYAKFLSRDNLSLYSIQILEADTEQYKNYDIEAGLQRNKAHLYLENNILYYREFHFSHDIDVFIVGENYQFKLNKILDIILNSEISFRVKHDIYVTSFDSRLNFPKVQIIKRRYLSIEELLVGFDLNSSRVAINIDNNGNKEILATKTYLDAITYGINIITPTCQSSSFNPRLAKYINKGFELYFPGNILDRFQMKKVINNINPKNFKHMYLELFSCYNSVELLKQNSSDYAEESHISNYIPYDNLEKRRKEISDAKSNVEIRDLLHIINSITMNNISRFSDNREHYDYKIIGCKYIGNLVKLSYILTQIGAKLSWKIKDPGSQINGSFNPTNVDYLKSQLNTINPKFNTYEHKFITLEETLKLYLVSDVTNLILEYTNYLSYIYDEILKALTNIIKNNDPPDLYTKSISDLIVML